MAYGSSSDPYCYPGTTVLINKAGLKTPEELQDFEASKVRTRARQPWPSGKLDKAHYLALHRHLFQDVYDWAGKPRTVRTGKSGNWFCFPEYIGGELDRLFADLRARDHLKDLALADFAPAAAHVLAELNAIHAFREGNGRTQLAFLRLLCLNAGHAFRSEALEPARVMSAMIASFDGDEAPLGALIADIAAP
ncbi:MAG: Fic family protein [Mesorhizobium sp.]|nr:Fic family protein [Mesorhizobium sp.]